MPFPETEPEANVPVWQGVGKWIQLTDFASWAGIATGIAASWKEDLENPEIVRLAESIAAQADTPRAAGGARADFFAG